MDRLKTPFRPPTRVMEAAGIRRSGRQVNQLKRRVDEDGTGEKRKPAVRWSEEFYNADWPISSRYAEGTTMTTNRACHVFNRAKLRFVLLSILAFPLVAQDRIGTVQVRVSTDRSDWRYEPGQPVRFRTTGVLRMQQQGPFTV